jgi:hypothetical protein
MLGKLAGQAKLNPALVKELITAIFLQTRAVFFYRDSQNNSSSN